MRLLIVGTLKGQLTTATKIAMDRGASVTHTETIEQALAVLRSGKGADLLDDDRMRLEFSGKLYAEPTVSWNSIDLPRGVGHNNLMSTRLTYTLSPRMFVSALVQYQSRTDSVTTNARFRWEYLPGSELFVVYSDGRTTTGPGFPALDNRSIVVKATKLVRF